MMDRRVFLTVLPALALIPAIAKAISSTELKIILYGDGIHDDSEAFQAWADGKEVFWSNGERVSDLIAGKHFYITGAVHLPANKYIHCVSFTGKPRAVMYFK